MAPFYILLYDFCVICKFLYEKVEYVFSLQTILWE